MSDSAVAQEKDQSLEPKYKKEIEKFRLELVEIASRTENLAWEHAVKVHYAVEELTTGFPTYNKKQFYFDLSRGHKWAAGTIKKAGLAVTKLFVMGCEEIAIQPASGYTQIADVVHSKLDVDSKATLARLVYKHDKKHPEAPYTVEQVRAMIKERLPEDADDPDWLRGTDFWEFDDVDPRFGSDGIFDRTPGQAIQNIIRRFGAGGGLKVLSVMSGGGTVMDVCLKDQKQVVADYRGIDIVENNHARKEHGEKFVVGDATQAGSWHKVCDPEWADIAIVTPPPHRHVANATTADKTNLGNVTEPEEYLSGLEVVISQAFHRLAVNGLMVVFVRQMGSYENGTPTPNAVEAVASFLDDRCNHFVASPVMRIAKKAPPGSAPTDDWVQPELVHILIYRK